MGDGFCEVIQGGRVVGFTHYYHSTGSSGSAIHSSQSEAWTQLFVNTKCTCGQPPADALLAAFYGGDFYWPAKVCLTCGAVVDGCDPYCDAIDAYGWPMEQTPEVIASQKKHEAWHAAGWPKSGHPLGHFQHELAEAT